MGVGATKPAAAATATASLDWFVLLSADTHGDDGTTRGMPYALTALMTAGKSLHSPVTVLAGAQVGMQPLSLVQSGSGGSAAPVWSVGPESQWAFDAASGAIVCRAAPALALDVDQRTWNCGVILWQRHGQANQRWALEPLSESGGGVHVTSALAVAHPKPSAAATIGSPPPVRPRVPLHLSFPVPAPPRPGVQVAQPAEAQRYAQGIGAGFHQCVGRPHQLGTALAINEFGGNPATGHRPVWQRWRPMPVAEAVARLAPVFEAQVQGRFVEFDPTAAIAAPSAAAPSRAVAVSQIDGKPAAAPRPLLSGPSEPEANAPNDADSPYFVLQWCGPTPADSMPWCLSTGHLTGATTAGAGDGTDTLLPTYWADVKPLAAGASLALGGLTDIPDHFLWSYDADGSGRLCNKALRGACLVAAATDPTMAGATAGDAPPPVAEVALLPTTTTTTTATTRPGRITVRPSPGVSRTTTDAAAWDRVPAVELALDDALLLSYDSAAATATSAAPGGPVPCRLVTDAQKQQRAQAGAHASSFSTRWAPLSLRAARQAVARQGLAQYTQEVALPPPAPVAAATGAGAGDGGGDTKDVLLYHPATRKFATLLIGASGQPVQLCDLLPTHAFGSAASATNKNECGVAWCQRWSWTSSHGHVYCRAAPHLALDLDTTTTPNANAVIAYTPHQLPNQKWVLRRRAATDPIDAASARALVDTAPAVSVGVLCSGQPGGWYASATDAKHAGGYARVVGSQQKLDVWKLLTPAQALALVATAAAPADAKAINAKAVDTVPSATGAAAGAGAGAGASQTAADTKAGASAAAAATVSGSAGPWHPLPPNSFVYLPYVFDTDSHQWLVQHKADAGPRPGTYNPVRDLPLVNAEFNAPAAAGAAGAGADAKQPATGAAKAPAAAAATRTLRVVTYNIWFSLWRRNQRMAKLAEIWHAQRPDIICLQEVTPETLQIILKLKWVRDHYCVSDASGQTVAPYGVLILSRVRIHHFSFTRFPDSQMYRMLLVAHTHINGQAVAAGTVHFESMNSAKERMAQMGVAFGYLAQYERSWLCGDFNFDSRSMEQDRLERAHSAFRDQWPRLHPDVAGDSMTHGGRWRPDRFCLRHLSPPVAAASAAGAAAMPFWTCTTMQLLGTEPFGKPEDDRKGEDQRFYPGDADCRTPSDHFGLFIQLTLQ